MCVCVSQGLRFTNCLVISKHGFKSQNRAAIKQGKRNQQVQQLVSLTTVHAVGPEKSHELGCKIRELRILPQDSQLFLEVL